MKSEDLDDVVFLIKTLIIDAAAPAAATTACHEHFDLLVYLEIWEVYELEKNVQNHMQSSLT